MMSSRAPALASLIAVAIALAFGAVLILVSGFDPLSAYWLLFYGAFGSVGSIAETLVKTSPLLLCALGLAVAFTCKFWNIGAEGQLFIGAGAATAVSLALPNLPRMPMYVIVFVSAAAAGGAWAAIPGFLKARLRINEMIMTFMMNFVAIFLVAYLVGTSGPLREKTEFIPVSIEVPETAKLLPVIPGTALHMGFLVAFVSVVAVHFLLCRTKLGFEIRLAGANPNSARAVGVSLTRTIVLAAFISGTLAGMAGMVQVLGVQYRLRSDLSPGYGYSAIAVALLGKLQPWAIALAATLFGALIVGANVMQAIGGIPASLVQVIQGVMVISVLASELLAQKGRVILG